VDHVLACALSPLVFEFESLQENQKKHWPDVLNLAKNICFKNLHRVIFFPFLSPDSLFLSRLLPATDLRPLPLEPPLEPPPSVASPLPLLIVRHHRSELLHRHYPSSAAPEPPPTGAPVVATWLTPPTSRGRCLQRIGAVAVFHSSTPTVATRSSTSQARSHPTPLRCSCPRFSII
jgi:hypothetical protein